jgi:hypothetical protein
MESGMSYGDRGEDSVPHPFQKSEKRGYRLAAVRGIPSECTPPPPFPLPLAGEGIISFYGSLVTQRHVGLDNIEIKRHNCYNKKKSYAGGVSRYHGRYKRKDS